MKIILSSLLLLAATTVQAGRFPVLSSEGTIFTVNPDEGFIIFADEQRYDLLHPLVIRDDAERYLPPEILQPGMTVRYRVDSADGHIGIRYFRLPEDVATPLLEH